MEVRLVMTGHQANDLRLLCGVARTLTLPVLVAKDLLSADEAAGIAVRVKDIEATLDSVL